MIFPPMIILSTFYSCVVAIHPCPMSIFTSSSSFSLLSRGLEHQTQPPPPVTPIPLLLSPGPLYRPPMLPTPVSFCACMCVSLCVTLCVCMCVRACVGVFVRPGMLVCVRDRMCVRVYACVCVRCTCAYVCVRVRTCAYVRVCG